MVILRLLSSRAGEPDDMRRQIMVIPQLFAIRRRSSPMLHRDKLWSFCTFCHPDAVSPITCRDKLLSFRTPFAIQIRSCPMARKDKLWSFCAFCHPEAVSPIICRDKLWSFRTTFRQSETIVSDATQRQFMVILRLLSSRGGEPDDMRRQIMVITHLFAIHRRSLWSLRTFLPSRYDRV